MSARHTLNCVHILQPAARQVSEPLGPMGRGLCPRTSPPHTPVMGRGAWEGADSWRRPLCGKEAAPVTPERRASVTAKEMARTCRRAADPRWGRGKSLDSGKGETGGPGGDPREERGP